MSAPAELVQIQRLPHIQRPIDNTALHAYMECPRKFFYGMIANRRKRGAPRPPLAYGTTWHAIMEWHYKTGGQDADLVYKEAVKSWQPPDDPSDHRTFDRCWSEYENYLDKWGQYAEESEQWGVTVGFPDSPLVELSTEISLPGSVHPYTGKIDRIVEHRGLYFVEDHKTTSAMGAGYFRQFDPSNQMMGYAALAQALTGLPIAGVRINAHAVLKRESKFERQLVQYSQPRLLEWIQNYNVWVQRIDDALAMLELTADDIDGAPDQILDPEARLLRAFPHNFEACAGKYGSCVYETVCTYPASVRQRILEAEFDYYPWDPMAEEEAE